MLDIQKIHSIDRPRERIRTLGASALSDIELLAALISSGAKGNGVLNISRELLKRYDERNSNFELEELMKVEGVGLAKAVQIIAAQEFFSRRINPNSNLIKSPKDILPLVAHLKEKKQEYFICITLDGSSGVISSRIITVGLINKTQIHPREVFADAIAERASAIIVAHNHPSGDANPSKSDIEATNCLKQSALILGINLIDHIIFTKNSYYSFLENNIL